MDTIQALFPEISALDKAQLLPSPSQTTSSQPRNPGTRKAQKFVNYLPGAPNISLNRTRVLEFMQKELCTPILDELYPRLWLVARRSFCNIDPLHQQALKGRKVFLTENIQLHLLWQDDKIHLKPVPAWLLNHQVWCHYLTSGPQAAPGDASNQQGKGHALIVSVSEPVGRAAAIGLLRSYAYLIQHESDFIIAHQLHLLPPSVNWVAWSLFIAYFREKEDHDVSNRYHYGQLRLSRLHWAVRLFQPRAASTIWFYYLPHWSMTPYLRSILAPLAFVFATLSLVLSAMQVVVSISAEDLGFSGVDESSLEKVRRAFWIFSISLVMTSSIIWVLLMFIPLSVLVWQLWWGFNHRNKAKDIRLIQTVGA